MGCLILLRVRALTLAVLLRYFCIQALHDRCAASLGRHFDDVYAYLKRVRNSPQPTAETEVQRKLMELVSNKKDLMQGCFMVDQLVFQEILGSGR